MGARDASGSRSGDRCTARALLVTRWWPGIGGASFRGRDGEESWRDATAVVVSLRASLDDGRHSMLSNSLFPNQSELPPTLLYRASNPPGFAACVGVFPDPDHGPASRAEEFVRCDVATTVGFDFLHPPFAVVLRERLVLRAAMPEAAVHEHRNVCTGKDDVGAATLDVGEWGEVDAEAQAHTVKGAPKDRFGLGVGSALEFHASSRRCICGDWSRIAHAGPPVQCESSRSRLLPG